MLAGNAGKTHETFRTLRARMSVQAVVTGMAAQAAGTDGARRTTDGDLLLNVLVKLVYAGNVAVETVNLARS